jgi:sugar lactone lactonase YvrE
MLRRISIALVGVGLVGWLLLSPAPIEPVAWSPPEPPALEGVFAPNRHLAGADRIATGLGLGPEDVAFDARGRLYTGFQDGRILRLSPGGDQAELFVDTGGHPLGLAFAPDGRLVVADALRHLIAVGPDGAIETLSSEAGGVPFHFVDGLDVAADGTVYFSDASSRFGFGQDSLDVLEHAGRGRLLAYDPRSGSARVLLAGLQFANGVALGPGDGFVLVSETGSYRVLRHWLKGPRSGETEVFIDNLPGMPDNIHAGESAAFWLALVAPRMFALDALAPYPGLRALVARLPSGLRPGPPRYGFVLGLDAEGRVTHNLQDPSGEVAHVTSAVERAGRLYLGSAWESQLRVATLP